MSAVLFRCLLPLPLTFPLALPPPALLPVLCRDSPPLTACTVSRANDWINTKLADVLKTKRDRWPIKSSSRKETGTALTKDTRGPNCCAHLSVRRAISKVRGARMGYEHGKYGGDKHRDVWKD
ncbi:hypothetical protein B0H16DRAFT_1616514, partial [Mycena metata]